jgi:hypothetical protein
MATDSDDIHLRLLRKTIPKKGALTMQMFSIGKTTKVLILVAVFNLAGGCAAKNKESVETPETDELAPLSTMVESYGDIELPIEMTLIGKESMAMRTDSFQGGIHVYRGRVEISSLKDYIIASMRNNKWKLVGEASYNNMMLAFTKPNKTAMVVLTDKGDLRKTQANFYVTVDLAAANRLNPFGEPTKQ